MFKIFLQIDTLEFMYNFGAIELYLSYINEFYWINLSN